MRKNKKDIDVNIDPPERTNRHRRKIKDKPYCIERRRIKEDARPFSIKWIEKFYGDRAWTWHFYCERYATKRDRNNALMNLQKKMRQPKIYGWRYEYRKPINE